MIIHLKAFLLFRYKAYLKAALILYKVLSVSENNHAVHRTGFICKFNIHIEQRGNVVQSWNFDLSKFAGTYIY